MSPAPPADGGAAPHDVSGVLREQAALFSSLADDAAWVRAVEEAGDLLHGCLSGGGLVLAAGNGGSMTDAMHLASELSGRYRGDRPALRSVALGDPSHLTAVANDYGFEHVFARGVEALGRPGDVLVALSTSGTSANVLRAAEVASDRGLAVLALTGRPGSPLGALATREVCAGTGPYADRVQEVHAVALHLITARVELLDAAGS
ncbi:MAG: D-sedoheptulose-7-phosphate isomerase [Microthrixaceae bacterium]